LHGTITGDTTSLTGVAVRNLREYCVIICDIFTRELESARGLSF